MRTVYKYPLKFVESQRVSLPIGAKLLSVQLQNGQLHLWAEVYNEVVREQELVVSTVGTGQRVPPGAVNYVGTVQVDAYVWHVYTSTLQ